MPTSSSEATGTDDADHPARRRRSEERRAGRAGAIADIVELGV